VLNSGGSPCSRRDGSVRSAHETRPAKGILVYTVDATVRDQQSPLVIIPKTTTNNNEYGPLCEAAYDVGDDVSVVTGGVSLGVKVIQTIGDCYHISISYTRP
jgi:hypothetical protein